MQTKYRQLSKDAQRLLELIVEIGRHNSLRDPIASLIERWGFTHAQLHSLMWLGQDGRLSIGTLARRVGATDKTITGIVDRLENKACVRRYRDENDRRVITVELTPKGRKSFEEIRSLGLKRIGNFLSSLNEKEREWLFRILERVIERSRPSNGQGAEPSPHITSKTSLNTACSETILSNACSSG
ncbi:MAG: MarR family transcriptional regulator, partial [Deltaproteobacteria bacterium]|nr:MarR family transcriptional regulator [Deltaproteobacteria bacterium]